MDSNWEQVLKKSQPEILLDGIVFDILSRLPVKSILRFKSVCTEWNSLFDNSQFIDAHFDRSGSCYLVRQPNHYLGGRIDREGFFGLRNKENFEKLCLLHVKPSELCDYDIVASAGGLVCIKKYDGSRNRSAKFYQFDLCIWNPATRESRIIPKILGKNYRFDGSLGFGYDPKNNDYKVIGISNSNQSTKVHVYSLRFDSWRVVNVDYYNDLYSPTICVNGRVHWLRNHTSPDLIVSFDIAEEKIIEMDLPELGKHDRCSMLESPASLGKSLILYGCSEEMDCQVWFMKQYGDSKSWTKLHYFPSNPFYADYKRPCFFLDNGKVVLFDGYMQLYDPNDETYRFLNINSDFDVAKYKESLVSIERYGSK